MWTYVGVSLSSEGAKVSEVVKILKEMGFTAILGDYDFVYKWDEKEYSEMPLRKFIDEKVIPLIEEVQKKLKGKKVFLRFKTVSFGV